MYSEENTHEGMAKYIVGAELLLIIVDNEHFIQFVKEYFQPRYIKLSGNTLRSDFIDYFIKHYKQLIQDLQKYVV